MASETEGSGKSLSAEWLRTRLTEMVDASDPELIVAKYERADSRLSYWVDCAGLQSLMSLSPWDREAELDKIRRSWLVVLDDLGTEPASIDLAGIIQGRESSELLTLITTNAVEPRTVENGVGEKVPNPRCGKMSDAWKERYDSRLASRMRAPGDADRGALSAWRHVPGPDLRSTKTPELVPVEEKPENYVDPERVDALFRNLAERMVRGGCLVAKRDEKELADRMNEERRLAEAAKRSVLAAMVLTEVESLADQGDRTAKEILRRAGRRMDA